MISMTCKELLQFQDISLAVQLKYGNPKDGECIGSTTMIQYTNLPIDDTLINTIAAAGCISALSYCFKQGTDETEEPLRFAAMNGQIETLKYLHDNGYSWDEDTSAAAAFNGHIEILKYLYEKDCSWDEDTPAAAAMNGQIETLKYLHEKGCP